MTKEKKVVNKGIFGIHHVTAITSDPQRNIDCYANNLGIRFVSKKNPIKNGVRSILVFVNLSASEFSIFFIDLKLYRDLSFLERFYLVD